MQYSNDVDCNRDYLNKYNIYVNTIHKYTKMIIDKIIEVNNSNSFWVKNKYEDTYIDKKFNKEAENNSFSKKKKMFSL